VSRGDDVLAAIARLRDELYTLRHVLLADAYEEQPYQRAALCDSIAGAALRRDVPDGRDVPVEVWDEYTRLSEALRAVRWLCTAPGLTATERVIALRNLTAEVLAVSWERSNGA
jgi:hypothetical protein